MRPIALATIIATYLTHSKYVSIAEAASYVSWDEDCRTAWFRVKTRREQQIPELEELSQEEGARVERELLEMQPDQ